MASKSIPARTTAPPSNSSKPAAPPSQTLYVSHLQDTINKEDLRRALYTLFSSYGPVLDVVALKTMKMRGQAHIVYRDIQASTQAMRSLQGFEFFGKEMRIQYAKTKSNIFTVLDGAYNPPNATTGASASTELQQSIFNAPPSSITASAENAKPGGSLKPPGDAMDTTTEDGARSPQGVKRRRDDESDEEDVPMDEDDDGDAPMEDSD